jgi:apolipoprotein N-acyltransferase
MSIDFRKSLTKSTDKLLEIGISLGSGILMGITFAPVEAWYLAWIALAPLWYLIARDRDSSKAKTIYALCWGIGCYGWGLAWIFGIHPMTWMGVPYLSSLGIATFCLTFITLWGASLVIIWSLCLRFIVARPHLNLVVRLMLGVACWCGLEELYSLTDLWWTSLALSQSPHNLPILHLGQLSGPSTVSAIIVLVNGLIAEGLLVFDRSNYLKPIPRFRSALPYLKAAIVSLITLHSIGFIIAHHISSDQPIESSLNIGIIQGNISNEVRHYQSGYDLAIDRYTQGYLTLARQKVDAVITPETAFPYRESQIKNMSFYRTVLDTKVPAFIGGFGEVKGGITNSLLMIDGNSKKIDRYDKWKLVPLGEYIPFEQVIGKLISTISPLDAHLIGGKFAPTVATSLGNFIFGICYDSAYPEHFRQQAKTGDLIITASNDAHYGAGMPAQHHAMDLMRAIETDRWMVRASNTGYSAIIDPHGQTQWISKLNEFTTHADRVYRKHTQTLYVSFGNWLTPLLFMIGIGLFFFRNSAKKSEI